MRIEKGTVENDGVITIHFQQRMTERKTGWFEVQEAISKAVIVRVQWDKDFKNWKYRLLGQLTDGSLVTVVVAIDDEENTLFFVTVFKETPTGRTERSCLLIVYSCGLFHSGTDQK